MLFRKKQNKDYQTNSVSRRSLHHTWRLWVLKSKQILILKRISVPGIIAGKQGLKLLVIPHRICWHGFDGLHVSYHKSAWKFHKWLEYANVDCQFSIGSILLWLWIAHFVPQLIKFCIIPSFHLLWLFYTAGLTSSKSSQVFVAYFVTLFAIFIFSTSWNEIYLVWESSPSIRLADIKLFSFLWNFLTETKFYNNIKNMSF